MMFFFSFNVFFSFKVSQKFNLKIISNLKLHLISTNTKNVKFYQQLKNVKQKSNEKNK